MRPSFKKALVSNSKMAMLSLYRRPNGLLRMKIQTLDSNLSVRRIGVVMSSITLAEGNKE
jgi:hypothetical protein